MSQEPLRSNSDSPNVRNSFGIAPHSHASTSQASEAGHSHPMPNPEHITAPEPQDALINRTVRRRLLSLVEEGFTLGSEDEDRIKEPQKKKLMTSVVNSLMSGLEVSYDGKPVQSDAQAPLEGEAMLIDEPGLQDQTGVTSAPGTSTQPDHPLAHSPEPPNQAPTYYDPSNHVSNNREGVNHSWAKGMVIGDRFYCDCRLETRGVKNQAADISSHISSNHNPNSAYKKKTRTAPRRCIQCRTSYKNFTSMERHMRSKHKIRGATTSWLRAVYRETRDGDGLDPDDFKEWNKMEQKVKKEEEEEEEKGEEKGEEEEGEEDCVIVESSGGAYA
ncbi:hypothetical protein GGS23DRAFT_600038 [Durotheca rogersii]|uniref:uncharacterized protein n=1 Tax=Durotheca rogersii TaxID=419775 RepID=UPI00221E8875|nr:uncharacterized protein GGS23DRAFT_600038 [Durotheca rogersii]KAI5859851.1 hypothetical protein GGS23DRAFT_600038 [Durotheca rogersii]